MMAARMMAASGGRGCGAAARQAPVHGWGMVDASRTGSRLLLLGVHAADFALYRHRRALQPLRALQMQIEPVIIAKYIPKLCWQVKFSSHGQTPFL